VISFTAGDLPEPERNLPRAMYVALAGTTALYVAISIGVFGILTVAEVTKYGATAVAEAARPTLGDAGFTAVTIAALLATSSSVNATLYASKGFTGTLAQVGQFPPLFGQQSRLGRHGGLVITVALILLFVNLFNLSAIASVGSAVSLSVFVLVGIAGYRLRDEIKGKVAILALAVAAAGFVLLFFVADTLRNDPKIIRSHSRGTIATTSREAIWAFRYSSEGKSARSSARPTFPRCASSTVVLDESRFNSAEARAARWSPSMSWVRSSRGPCT
jgi:amino acid transporter